MRINTEMMAEHLYDVEDQDYVEMAALDNLVDHFQGQMKSELHEQYEAGRRGWDDPGTAAEIGSMLRDATEREDWVSVANLAAMLWNFQQEEPPAPDEEAVEDAPPEPAQEEDNG